MTAAASDFWLLAADYYSFFNSEIRDSHRSVVAVREGSLACPLAPQPVISASRTLLLTLFTILFTMYTLTVFSASATGRMVVMGEGWLCHTWPRFHRST